MTTSKFIFCGVQPGYHNISKFTPETATKIVSDLLSAKKINIPVYSALMVSSNVCAARVIQEVGVRSVIQIARVLGIETPLEYDYTIALGSNGVKLFEFTRAYGAFANGGYVVQPYGIERVETSRGKVVYKASKTKITHQLSLKTAAEMTAMLRTVITNGTGAAANIGKPAAGKTGTIVIK